MKESNRLTFIINIFWGIDLKAPKFQISIDIDLHLNGVRNLECNKVIDSLSKYGGLFLGDIILKASKL